MPANERCPRCGSDRVIPDARLSDEETLTGSPSRRHEICVDGDPHALVAKRTAYAQLRARVCAARGHVDLYVDTAYQLYEAYRPRSAGRQS
ncbi:MAG TPA: hypothetical protein VFW96_02655 [Thermomicrobiales bacterium]|nr:hypothetical protein [Thermomicrobiales bacterium]